MSKKIQRPIIEIYKHSLVILNERRLVFNFIESNFCVEKVSSECNYDAFDQIQYLVLIKGQLDRI